MPAGSAAPAVAHRRRAACGLRVAGWYLTMPLNPTNKNLQWLEGFTAGHGLVAQWRGLDLLEGLADYPSVID